MGIGARSFVRLLAVFLLFGGLAPAIWSATLKPFDPLGTEGTTKLVREYQGTIWTLPNCRLDYTQAVMRSKGRHFFLRLELLDDVTFASAVDPLLVTPTESTFSVLSHAGPGGRYVEWYVLVNSTFTYFPTFSVFLGGVSVNVGSRIRSGEVVNVKLSARDSNTGFGLETPLTVRLLEPVQGVSLLGFLPGSQRIDVAEGRKLFVEPFVTTDESPRMAVAIGVDAYRHTGEPMVGAAAVTDQLQITVYGNLTRIADLDYGGTVRPLTEEEQAGPAVDFSVPYVDLMSFVNLPVPFLINLTTTIPAAPIDPRTLMVNFLYNYGHRDYDDVPILTEVALTTWSLNGTVLTANWVNGNTAALDSWIFLKNESSMKGAVQVEVFSLPRFGTPSVSLGILDLGMINGSGVMRLNLGEHILGPLGIPLPYTENGGNLALEFVLAVPDATGTVQVFRDRRVSYGTYPMNKVANAESGIYYIPTPGVFY